MKRILNLLFTVVVLLSTCINQQLTDKYTFNEFMIGCKANTKPGTGAVGVEYNGESTTFQMK